INNTAPTTPPSISVPTIVIGGGNLVITWNSSTDAEGNLSGYVLERTSNGGTSWTQIYKGANLSYTDAITKGWPTVQYRVKAYDSYDLESDWRTSVARTVDNSVAPTITSTASGDLGLKSDGFTWGYIIGQDDNETVTVVESMDDVQKRSYTAALGASNTFDVTGQYFMKLLNGSRSMKVTATASSGKSATHTVTFTKGVYSCSITMTAPLPADALIKKMVMNITRSIPADAAYTVQVTNNANDPSPVWEDITNNIQLGLNHVFANATAVNGSAFNFKITASRGLGNTGGFVSAIGGAFE
ncbi:MAG: fibronectin type III domain-containing protein, partial [Firmicutes bacterium]|nr:fibronectin type III domain-containing protein [Bacillota bacterium]